MSEKDKPNTACLGAEDLKEDLILEAHFVTMVTRDTAPVTHHQIGCLWF